MKNVDLICFGIIIMFLVLIWSVMQHMPAVRDRRSPLPSGLYTNGAPSVAQSNQVLQRVNFQQQPTGSNYS